MLLNNYYEDIPFLDGKIINTSRIIQNEFSDMSHWHPFVEILLCLKPGNEVTLNFRKYNMAPNDFIICFPGDLHLINNITPDSFLIIQFPMELITVVQDFKNLQPLLSRNSFCAYDPGNMDHEKMVMLIKDIVSVSEKDIPFVEAKLYSLLLVFFSIYGQYFTNLNLDENADIESAQYKSSKLMAEACLYISQNCSEALTLDDVAHQIGISKSYFSHLFKDYTQMTFVDYLTKERIRKAESLFLGPKKKFIDIAFECGFTSISSFNRTFKKIKGISPREFRNAMIQSTTLERQQ